MKTAWFLGHRIRLGDGPWHGNADWRRRQDGRDRRHGTGSVAQDRAAGWLAAAHIAKVLSLVERGGNIRSVTLDHRGIGPRLYKHLDKRSRLVSDSAPVFKFTGAAKHEAVDHSKFEWARGDVHTNTLEGFFSVFKRGIIGVYQHVDSQAFRPLLGRI